MKHKGLPNPRSREIDEYLNMPRSELARQSVTDLGEIQYEILTYAYYLQDLNNEQNAKIGKFKDEMNKIIVPMLDNYQHIFKDEDKRVAAICDNSAAAKWAEYISNSQAAATRTAYLAKRLESIATCIENIAKRRYDG